MLLLRALQERRYKPVGSTWEYTSNIRLVAATSENLEWLNMDLTVGREETAPLSEEEKEKQLLLKTLEEAEGNRARAARMLGISRTSLYEKLRKYRII